MPCMVANLRRPLQPPQPSHDEPDASRPGHSADHHSRFDGFGAVVRHRSVDRLATGGVTLVYHSPGADAQSGNIDDIRYHVKLVKNKQGEIQSTGTVDTAPNSILNDAKDKIEKYFQEHNEEFPLTADGQELVGAIHDSWDEPLKYRLINRNSFRITSTGPDKKYMTPDEVVLVENVTRPSPEKASEPLSWLERRRIEVRGEGEREKIDVERGQSEKTSIESQINVGGQTTLEGAKYFWFWTKLMVGSAIGFIFVAVLYKPREFLQEETEVEN